MNPLSRKHPRQTHRSQGFLLVIIALLALPYLMDVIYYGDFTPTHFAQENLIEEESQLFDDEDSSWLGTDQLHPAHHGILVLLELPAFSPELLSTSDLVLPHYLITASFISRPPPVL